MIIAPFIRSRNFFFIVSADGLLLATSFYLASALQFEFQIPSSHREFLVYSLPLIVVMKMSIFFMFHLYQGMWRYTNLSDLLNVFRAVLMSSILIILTVGVMYNMEHYPWGAFIVDGILSAIFVAGLRVGVRLYFAKNSNLAIFPILSRAFLKGKKFVLIETSSFLLDAFLVLMSISLAYHIRFEFQVPREHFQAMVNILPLVLIVKMSVFVFFHIYQGIWRYASLFDLINVVKAVVISSMGIILEILLMNRFEGYPRSVFILDCGLTLLFVGGIRAGARLYYAENGTQEIFPFLPKERSQKKRLLLIGAGSTGEKVLREILDNPRLNLLPVGILDDVPETHGRTIHGIKVLGGVNQIQSFQGLFDEILIAITSASGQQMRNIVEACKKTGKRFRTVPAIGELINGNVSVKAVRDVTMEDLLGREEISLNKDGIVSYLREKRVLITGAGGSIGSELVRQVSKFHPEALALVEMNEFNLFHLEMECRQRFSYLRTDSFLADIRDICTMERVFRDFRPQVVFHAAAYKHVPIQEIHPWEAVRNNIVGTRNLVQVAHNSAVERFVLVSTDKAVRPTNVMGATKRVAEQLIACSNGLTSCQFMAVRFGNVLGSSGSVIPIFQEQIRRGGPITVTHPEVTRYFMSIPEAAQLILEAGAMGRGGEIFLLDMGKPVRIASLARELIRLHGYEPERDISIQYVGLRPGEKLYEELITEGEGIVKTGHEKILVLKGNGYDAVFLDTQINELLEIIQTYDTVKIKQKLQEIVPEYTPEIKGYTRKYARYVLDIPLVFSDKDPEHDHYREYLHDISLGGLAFHSHVYLKQGERLRLEMPLVMPMCAMKGHVVWCRKNQDSWVVGIQFVEEDVHFRTQIITQIQHIEQYKDEVLEMEHKELSGEEAAVMWIQKYAKERSSNLKQE